MQCSNHVKQIGLGIHNFHDTQMGLPPYSVGYDGASMWALIYPYIEQQALYDFIVNRQGTTYKGFELPANNQWWKGITEQERKNISSVPIYSCPTRRSSGNFTTDCGTSDSKEQMNASTNPASGPCGDYGMVFMSNNGSNQWYARTSLHEDAAANDHKTSLNLNACVGPFRLAKHQLGLTNATTMTADNSKTCASWMPRDTMSWWIDGTSNQLVVGEKHIPPYALGKCDGDGTQSAGGTAGRRSDCSYLTAHGWRSVGSARSFRQTNGGTTFPLSSKDYGAYDTAGTATQHINGASHFGFGSWHSGICQFLIGDGSVRAISNTTPVQTILIPLAIVNDGESVTF